MAGKLTKLAAGVLMTHYTRSKVDLALLADITRAAGGPEELAAADQPTPTPPGTRPNSGTRPACSRRQAASCAPAPPAC